MDANEKLLEAFEDQEYQENLKDIRLKIEDEINIFLNYLQKELKAEQKIFGNIESRIKSLNSFTEKLSRKEYSNKWNISTDKQKNQKTISTKLTDLIGFRINCFFMEDEKQIYDLLKNYYEEKKFVNLIELDFTENTKQKNGLEIYKVSGKYKEVYSFEIQIKSLFHNVWGEVEHKTIYKGRHFDTNLKSKKIITEQIFNILSASDKQLLEVFKSNQNERSLIQTLFYQKTQEKISAELNTNILSEIYQKYFEIFKNPKSFKLIEDYVGHSLLGKDGYIKDAVEINKKETSKINKLNEELQNQFSQYELNGLYKISSLLIIFNNFNDFMNYFSEYLLTEIFLDIDDEYIDDINYDEFSDSADSYEEEESFQPVIDHLSTILKKRS